MVFLSKKKSVSCNFWMIPLNYLWNQIRVKQQIIGECPEFGKTAFSDGETSAENFWQVPQIAAY